MTALLVVLVPVVLAALALGIGWGLHRRALDRERRRVDALTSLESRLRSATASLELPAPAPEREQYSAPLAAPGSRGRAALLEALTDAVAGARADRSRLSVALVESRETSATVLAAEVADATGSQSYEVGPRAVALVVRGGGRAEALGLLARIQAACGARGDAVELQPGESAVGLLTRALSTSRARA